MKTWILSFLIGIFLFFIFLFLSFPWSRLGPKLANELEQALSQSLRGNYECELRDFSLSFPFGFKMNEIKCLDRDENSLFAFEDVSSTLLPFYQDLKVKLGDGFLRIKTDAGFNGRAKRFQMELQEVDLQGLMPLIFSLNNAFLFSTPVQLSVEGIVSGEASIPLRNLAEADGHLRLDFKNLRLPTQLYLDLIGLRELRISPAVVDIELTGGNLNLKEVAFISTDLAAKAEGSLKLEAELQNSTGNLLLKWKVQRSDALLSSPIGSQLLNTPCPSPDSQGFCTRRVTRLSEISSLFQPTGFRP